MEVNVIPVFRSDVGKEGPFLAFAHGSFAHMNGITDKSWKKEPDLLRAMVERELHETVDVTAREEGPALGHS